MLRRKESWAKPDVLFDQDDFEEFTDLTPFRRMPLEYEGPVDDDLPWLDPLRSGGMVGHMEGDLGTVATRRPPTPAQLKRQQQLQDKTGDRAARRQARESAKEAVEREQAQLRQSLQLKSYLENLEWALPAKTLPGLVETFRRFVNSCKGRTVLPRELASQLLQAAGIRNPKDYQRFYLEHGRGLWLPRKLTEYMDTFSRPENAEFFGVEEVELYPPRTPSPRWQPLPTPVARTAAPGWQSVPRSVQKVPHKRPPGELAVTAPAQMVQNILRRYQEAQAEAADAPVPRAPEPASLQEPVTPEMAAFRQGRREFATVRALAVQLRLPKVADYLVGFLDHRLPVLLHPRPDLVYAPYWQGWQHYLGSPAPVESDEALNEYLPEMTDGFVEYEFAQEYAKQSGKTTAADWVHYKTRHPAVPANPDHVYAHRGFTTWAKFLGVSSRSRRI